MRFLTLLFCITLCAAVAVTGWLASQLIDGVLSDPLVASDEADSEQLLLTVLPGSSIASVAADLQRRGQLDEPRKLTLYARFTGDASQIKAGEYRLEPGLTIPGLVDKLVEGDVIQHALTIVEGVTFRQLWAQLRQHPSLRLTLAENSSDAQIMAAIGKPEQHPEGRFLPETYLFPKGMTDVDFLRRANRALEQALAQEWAGRDEGLPYAGPEEALVMASIIEKETGQASERPDISGVFVRRLRKGMRLQTDPTVIYGMGAAYDGNIRRADLRRPTPYNTYVISGLPPTPIALAGRAALNLIHTKNGA